MKQFKSRLLYNAAGYAVSLMYSYGIAVSLIITHLLNFTPLDAFKYTALMLFVLTILFYNRWTSLFTLIAAGIYAFWAIRYGGAEDWFFNNVPPFITEALNFVQGKAPLSDIYHFPLGLVFIAVTILFSRISASRLRGCPSLVIVAAAVFITEWSLGHRNIILSMALCATAIAAVYAYSFARHLFVRDMSDAEDDYTEEDELFKEGETVKAERRTVKIPNATALAVYAIPLALVASLLTSIILPGSAESFKSVSVEKVVDDTVDYFGQYSGFSRKQFSFSISSLGFSNTSTLGGPVKPSDTIALVVEGISPSLLKGSSKCYYDGKGWKNNINLGSYRYDSSIWGSKRSDVFDLERPDIKDRDLMSMLYRTVSLRITPYQNLYTIFSPTRPVSVTGSNKNFIPYFDNVGELYPKHKIGFMQTYTVTARQVSGINSRFTDFILKCEKEVPPENTEKMTELRKIYLQLPEELPSSVRKLGHDLAQTAGSSSPFLRALAIRQYLLDNFTYTLTPPVVPEGRDFVDYFLETKVGYCSYYASAMTVLARSAGIPARYCEGFLMTNLKNDKFIYTVTGKNAHAWAELYFEGIGWIPFDATPIGQPRDTYTPAPNEPSKPEIPTPSPSVTAPVVMPAPSEQANLPFWLIAALVLAALILINFVIVMLHRMYYSSRHLIGKYGKRGSVEIWWRAILDTLPYQDKLFGRRDGETSVMLASRIGYLVQCPVCTMDQLVRIVMRAFYSSHEISDVEAEVVYRYYRTMQRRLLKMMTPPVFAVKCVLFPKVFGFRGVPKKLKPPRN